MYSRAETSQIKQEFWTALGKYLSPIFSSVGEKVNWINYKTGFKYIQFTMEAETDKALISIVISPPEMSTRHLYWSKFKELEGLFTAILEEQWIWEENISLNGKQISRIYKELKGINILNKNDWPEIISFFKPRIIRLDSFWNETMLLFEEFKYL